MHAIAWRALSTPHRHHLGSACRVIAGVRRPRSRNFHRSAVAYRIPEDPTNAAANETKDDGDVPHEVKGASIPGGEVTDGLESRAEPTDVSQRPRRRGDRNSAARRANKPREAPGVPQLVIPDWFLEKNVRCLGEPDASRDRLDHHFGLFDTEESDELLFTNPAIMKGQKVSDSGESRYIIAADIGKEVMKAKLVVEEAMEGLKSTLLSPEKSKEDLAEPRYSTDLSKPDATNTNSVQPEAQRLEKMKQWQAEYRAPKARERRYAVRAHVYWETLCSISADLKLPPPKTNIKDVVKPDTVLYCPINWPTNYLNTIVKQIALDERCDVIRLDSEDIAEILGEYLGENVAWTKGPTARMGYNLRRESDRFVPPGRRAFRDEEEADDADENEDVPPSFTPPSPGSKRNRPHLSAAVAVLPNPSKFLGPHEFSKGISLLSLLGQTTQSANSGALSPASGGDNWLEYKLSRALDMLIGAADAKRVRHTLPVASHPQASTHTTALEARGLIIQINDYKELNDHPVGSVILAKLREIVKRRWYEGQKIVIVGTTADEEIDQTWGSAHNLAGHPPSETVLDQPKVIFVPPEHSEDQDALFLEDERKGIRNLNIRRLVDMFKKLSGTESGSQLNLNLSYQAEDSEVERHIWDYGHVRRIAMMMLGYGAPRYGLDGPALSDALRHLKKSDEARHEWVKKENEKQDSVDGNDRRLKTHITAARTVTQDKVEKLKETCNRYERKLLAGVIDPADLHTTFDDVRAPPETIEALKTLTSLALIRPDAFVYGVLATDKISGLLLYGPPGTGKTLLAKAVAKESGATVLEISASEINDMYVGEGEKNVKAVFSLAKKLSPCVVFIDEADALFQARTQSRLRASHRELINQFLREWDGMNNLSTFVMVATNRPFDLDEAVLRRLPRRLLIDLPIEKDREAILKIHLKDEILDESVSLAQLAKDTPYYSGSDLKNLSVAAALACVREENAAAASYIGDKAYVFPPKRILRKQHFIKAMDEISASISEDMSTLSAIRKFDEKYGDRKGRRKKGPGLGFGGTMDPEIDSEAGRVRKVNLEVAV